MSDHDSLRVELLEVELNLQFNSRQSLRELGPGMRWTWLWNELEIQRISFFGASYSLPRNVLFLLMLSVVTVYALTNAVSFPFSVIAKSSIDRENIDIHHFFHNTTVQTLTVF